MNIVIDPSVLEEPHNNMAGWANLAELVERLFKPPYPNLINHLELKKKIIELENDPLVFQSTRTALTLKLLTLLTNSTKNIDEQSEVVVIVKKQDNQGLDYSHIFCDNAFITKLVIDEFLAIKTFLSAHIITEGKTDQKHIKQAFKHFKKKREFLELDLSFDETTETDKGWSSLLGKFKNSSSYNLPNSRIDALPCIHIFDRDCEFDEFWQREYRSWLNCCTWRTVPVEILYGNETLSVAQEQDLKSAKSNGVIWKNSESEKSFAFLLPVPLHRTKFHTDICIEMYYFDKDLRRDSAGKRLYTNQEFDSNGKHYSDDKKCHQYQKTFCGSVDHLKIVDSERKVQDSNYINYALSKNEFSELIFANSETVNFQIVSTNFYRDNIYLEFRS